MVDQSLVLTECDDVCIHLAKILPGQGNRIIRGFFVVVRNVYLFFENICVSSAVFANAFFMVLISCHCT